MRSLRAVAIGWLLLAVPCGYAQQGQPERVGGKVVNARDGRPVAGAMLELVDAGSRGSVVTVRSGEDGSFRFDPMPAGKYDLSGDAPGFLHGSYLEHEGYFTGIVTGKGLATGALVLELTPAASISGHVADEDGEPVQQGVVRLYRENPNSMEGITRGSVVPLDDEGAYAFEKLAPGRYYVAASASPWYAVHPMPESQATGFGYRSAVDPSLDVAYPLVFYPNAMSSDGASPIDVKGGEEVTADMQMTPQQALTITLQSAAGETPNGAREFHPVMLMRSVFGKEDDQMGAQMSIVNGVTSLVGIPPGQYRAQEFSPRTGMVVRSQEIDLTNGSVTVPSAPAAELANVKVSLQAAAGSSLPGQVQIGLRNPKSERFAPSQTSVHGVAEFHDVPVADYELTVFGDGQRIGVAALSVDGHPAADKRLHLSGAGTVEVKLALAGAPVKIEGFARRDGRAAVGCMVVLVPAATDADRELFRRDQTNLDGSFTLEQVLPGKYILVAIDEGWKLRWDDPAALMPYLLHGTPIEVPAGRSSGIQLKEPLVAQPR